MLHAAETLFTSRRLHEITLEEVAERAGVGKGTIYRYFRDKDDLFFEVVNSGFDELCELVGRRMPGPGGFDRQLLEVCRQVGRFFDARRQLLGIMQLEENRMYFCRGRVHERLMAQRRRLLDAMARLIRHGVDEGFVRRDVPPEALAGFLLGMLRTLARDLPDDVRPPDGYASVIDLFYNGAGCNAPHRPAAARAPAHAGVNKSPQQESKVVP
jgi:AcrR family transcriptional regulator